MQRPTGEIWKHETTRRKHWRKDSDISTGDDSCDKTLKHGGGEEEHGNKQTGLLSIIKKILHSK